MPTPPPAASPAPLSSKTASPSRSSTTTGLTTTNTCPSSSSHSAWRATSPPCPPKPACISMVATGASPPPWTCCASSRSPWLTASALACSCCKCAASKTGKPLSTSPFASGSSPCAAKTSSKWCGNPCWRASFQFFQTPSMPSGCGKNSCCAAAPATPRAASNSPTSRAALVASRKPWPMKSPAWVARFAAPPPLQV